MTEKRFERWNWEFDCGEAPIAEGISLPPRYAIAYYDYRGRLYRVVKRVKQAADCSDDDPTAFEMFVYDYFCDADGRILQKRSLDERGSVFLIVDFNYDLQKNEVTETAWWPDGGQRKSRTRPLQFSDIDLSGKKGAAAGRALGGERHPT